jgi:transcription elongation factor GreA|tara:strand:+ start:4157 stop:4612 length:456 start_codon:yes stop_codon:yes gene_type:complete
MEKYITKEGLEKVQKELKYLKDVKRKEITKRLQKAISFGDLSENFDYHNAKEEQELLERKIAELEGLIAGSRVIEKAASNGIVQVGSQVTLDRGGEKWIIALCGPQEANPLQDKISASSPLGDVLLGKKKGEKIEIETPQGKTSYKILEIA